MLFTKTAPVVTTLIALTNAYILSISKQQYAESILAHRTGISSDMQQWKSPQGHNYLVPADQSNLGYSLDVEQVIAGMVPVIEEDLTAMNFPVSWDQKPVSELNLDGSLQLNVADERDSSQSVNGFVFLNSETDEADLVVYETVVKQVTVHSTTTMPATTNPPLLLANTTQIYAVTSSIDPITYGLEASETINQTEASSVYSDTTEENGALVKQAGTAGAVIALVASFLLM